MKAYNLASEGYFERNKDEWERTRIIAYNAIAPHLKKNTSPTAFMPFAWDKDKGIKPFTKEQALEKYRLAKEQFKNLA